MNSHDLTLVHNAELIDDDSLTLGQLCRACDVHADWVINLVEESIIEPHGDDLRLWRFSGASLIRVRSAYRLQRDLGVNLAGIALILDLIEEIDGLRTKLGNSDNGV